MADDIIKNETADGDTGAGEATTDPAILDQAKRFGYREDYTGQNKLSPEEFVARTFQRLDIATGTVKTLEKRDKEWETRNKALEEKIDRMTANFGQFVEMSKKDKEQAVKRAVAEVEARMEQAVTDSDVPAFKAAQAELKDLNKSIADHPALTGTDTKPADTEAKTGWKFSAEIQDQWLDDNPWFDSDFEMAMYAKQVDSVFSAGKKGREHKSQKERLDAVTAEVKKKFPDYFAGKGTGLATTKPRVSAVEGSEAAGPPSNGKGKKTFNDLVPEAKAMAKSMVEDGILKSVDDYVAVADASLFRS